MLKFGLVTLLLVTLLLKLKYASPRCAVFFFFFFCVAKMEIVSFVVFLGSLSVECVEQEWSDVSLFFYFAFGRFSYFQELYIRILLSRESIRTWHMTVSVFVSYGLLNCWRFVLRGYICLFFFNSSVYIEYVLFNLDALWELMERDRHIAEACGETGYDIARSIVGALNILRSCDTCLSLLSINDTLRFSGAVWLLLVLLAHDPTSETKPNIPSTPDGKVLSPDFDFRIDFRRSWVEDILTSTTVPFLWIDSVECNSRSFVQHWFPIES